VNSNSITSSSEFIYLRERLERIKEAFGVDEFKHEEWNLLSDNQRDYVRAYIALCHAEFEAYLEQRAMSIINQAFDLWNDNRQVSLPLLALFAHFQFIDTNADTNEKIHMIVQKFKDSIRKNNGIKDTDLRKLFRPIGVNEDDIDSVWILTLNSYGKTRGDTLHTSAQVQQPISIIDVIEKIRIIIEGMSDFEVLLNNLLTTI
jgi:hypothetical protein